MERARLSLLGLAVGDAFGETLFGPPERSQRRCAERTLEARRPWRWTDDTAMALSIVEVLGRCGGADPDQLIEAFARRWREAPDRGYGQGAFNLLTRVSYGAPWREEARRMFGGQGSMGNGAAMRVAPLGAYFADDLERVVVEAARSAEPTHAHPEGAAGAVAVAVAAALAWRAQETPFDRGEFFDEILARTPDGPTRKGIAAAARAHALAPFEAADILGTGLQILATDTVPWCLWVAARHLGSYEDACWIAAGEHGDRDTNAAIVGGIVVLAVGEAGIPATWRAAVEAVPDPLANPPG